MSVNSGGCRRTGSVNIHRYSPPLRRELLTISFTKFRLCLVDVLSRRVDLTSLSALFSLFMVSRYCNFCCWFLWPDSRALSSSSLRMVCRNRGSHIFNSYSSRRTIDNWDRDLKCQLSQRLRTNHMPISKQNHITITTVNINNTDNNSIDYDNDRHHQPSYFDHFKLLFLHGFHLWLDSLLFLKNLSFDFLDPKRRGRNTRYACM